MTATTTTNNNGDDDDEKSENDLSFLRNQIRSKKLNEKRTTSNKFGNGILQPRKEQIERGIDTIAAALVPPLRINDVSHEDFELGAVATDPPLRFPKSLLSDLTNIPFCLLYTSPSPRDRQKSRMPSSA